MKKLLVVIAFFILIVTACVPVATTPQQSEPPVAYIDSVLPMTITQGDKLTFTGHGTAKTGSVVAFQWRSSEDGVISNAPTFATSSLSVARHTIYFKVQSNTGDWSPEVYFFINVVPAGATKPVINVFACVPSTIIEGNQVTINWNVSNATTVNITPDIGNVPLSGNRTVSLNQTTVYTLSATNVAGNTTTDARVNVTKAPVHTIELNTIIQENGSARYDGITVPYTLVGVKDGPYMWEGFLSFDISMIPQNATIKTAFLDISDHEVYGTPFNLLGNLGVFPITFSKIGTKTFISNFPGGAVVSIRTEPTQQLYSGLLTSTIQEMVSLKSTRYQLRLQFEKYFYSLVGDNYMALLTNKPKLIITYED